MRKVIMVTGLFSILVMLGQNLCWAGIGDGQMWRNLSEDYKLSYCVGFLVGTANVINHSELELQSKWRRSFEETGEIPFSMSLETLEKVSPKELYEDYKKLELFNISPDQLEQKIDNFYSDASNLNIKIEDAVYVVKAQIHGQNPELIDFQIRYLRMVAISKKYEPYPLGEDLLKALNAKEIKLDTFEKNKRNPWLWILIDIAGVKLFRTEVKQKIIDEIKWDGKDPKTLIKKVVQEGWVTREDFVKTGYYCGEDGSLQKLFCYGDYESK